jgi:hypothetical protein
MALPTSTLDSLLMGSPQNAWDAIREELKRNCCEAITGNAVDEIVRREKQCEPLELALSGGSWTLWKSFFDNVPSTSQRLIEWWNAGHGGKAILILDGLSIREFPILLAEAESRGFNINESEIFGSELPAETNAFAKALGFSHRGSLDNNGAGGAHKLNCAYTLSNDLPWKDLAESIPAESKIVAWHEWPDNRVHDYSDQGEGIRKLLPEVVDQLKSDDFWTLAAKLCEGRELVITSDHGYANTGAFRDADAEEKIFFKENFGGYRYKKSELNSHEWLPPLALALDCPTGHYNLAMGRTKWAVQGGNRTLSHGGLSLFETFVPFIRLSKN